MAAKKLRQYLASDDAQRFDLIKDNLSAINFFLSEQAVDIAKGQSSIDMSKLVQLCTALGISYDKLYSKRDTGIKVLAFPAPLRACVTAGLQLANTTRPAQAPTPSASVAESSPVPVPVTRSTGTRYKSPLMQQAHAALCPDVAVTYPGQGGGSGVGSSAAEGAGV